MPRANTPTWLASLGLLCAAACSSSGDLRERIEAAGVYSPARSDSVPPAVTELGRVLFFDPELSGNRNVACSSCHLPMDHAADGQRLGIGQDGGTGAGTERHGGCRSAPGRRRARA